MEAVAGNPFLDLGSKGGEHAVAMGNVADDPPREADEVSHLLDWPGEELDLVLFGPPSRKQGQIRSHRVDVTHLGVGVFYGTGDLGEVADHFVDHVAAFEEGRRRVVPDLTVGAEVFGAAGPDIDAELLAMCQRIWQLLGLNNIRLEVNSLGTSQERARYRENLYAFLNDNRDSLDADSLRRLERNPLRILDSKNSSVQELLRDAPVLADYLGEESVEHFDGFCSLLQSFDVPYQVNPRLVRGLDYYSHTVFEWITSDLGAQGTVCAGGRYDGLVEIQGGKPWPGVGFAMGQERLVELMREQSEPPHEVPHVYCVMVGAGAIDGGMKLAEQLRQGVKGLRIQSNLGGGSFKSQFKRADRSGAALAMVLGEDELQQRRVTIKHLRDRAGQEEISLDDVESWFQNYLRMLN